VVTNFSIFLDTFDTPVGAKHLLQLEISPKLKAKRGNRVLNPIPKSKIYRYCFGIDDVVDRNMYVIFIPFSFADFKS